MKQSTSNLLILVLLIAVVSGAIVWSYLSLEHIVVSASLLLMDLVLVMLVFNLNKKTQRKITYFFDAIENNDSTIFFNDKVKNHTERNLNKSLNRVNGLIKQIKQQLVEQEKYYQVLLEHSSSGIICFEKNGNVILANKAATQLLNLHVLTHLKQLSRIDEQLYQRISKISGNDSFSTSIISKRGRVQLSISTSIFKMDNKQLRLLSLQDISTPLSDKEMESWTKLTRVLTHEIMNNLSPVISLSQDIQKRLENSNLDPEKAKKAFEIIQTQSQSLMHFVETYRKFTKIHLPNKQDISISDLFDRIRILYGSFSQSEAIEFKVSNPKEDIKLFIDEGQLVQVLINLVKNAVEAFEENERGIIKVWAENNADQNQTHIYISDDGAGIPADVLERVFVPFFTTKDEGSGIGLSICRQIMQLQNGTMHINSIEGKGTTVNLVFK